MIKRGCQGAGGGSHILCTYAELPEPLQPEYNDTVCAAKPVTFVTLTVFNTLGQKVRTLVDEVVDARYQSVEFEASELASGVYIYRMQAGDIVQAKKLIVVK